MPAQETKSRNFWPARIAAAFLILVVIGSMSAAAFRIHQKAEKSLEDQFAVRATSASTFLDSYVVYTLNREQELAKLRLGTKQITHDQFLDFLDNFGFGPSVLLDDTGHVIDVAPYKQELIGKQITADNEHLRAAVVNGEQTVSNVIPSDALKFPNVAFATPFETQAGTRIISGAYDLTTKPLGNYFENIVPNDGGHAYLVDEDNNVIASNSDKSGYLSEIDTELANTVSKANKTKGYYKTEDGKQNYFVVQSVNGTPWRVIIAIDKEELLKPETGVKLYLPWAFLFCFATVAIVLVILLVRNRERRLKLQDVSLIDLQTGVYNSRGIKSQLNRLTSAARRHQNDLTIFKINIDDLSSINERFGHNVGDEILVLVSDEIQKRLRTEDIIGRCKGEEFIVILPDTDSNGANIVAERIRRGVFDEVRSATETDAQVTISIGIASFQKDDTTESLSARADEALKESKTTGKNKVTVSDKETVSSSI